MGQVSTGLVNIVLAVLQTALIAWFGFALTGRLELVLKERSMTLQSANALAALVTDLQDTTRDAQTQAAAVRRVAMYGSEAAKPLTIMAAAVGPYDEEIPLEGLSLVAIHHKEDVCSALRTAVAEQSLIDKVRFKSIEKLHKKLKC